MSQFKLIAITPLLDCSTDYRKNLVPGRPYQFYSDYVIKFSDEGKEILSVIKKKDSVPENLYELDNGIDLSFSAVVGKNGTGKSTLFELFSYFIYVLSTHKSIGERRVLTTELEGLILQHKDAIEDYTALEKSIEVKVKGNAKTDEDKSSDILALALIYKEKYDLYVSNSKLWNELSFAENILEKLNEKILGYDYDIKQEEDLHRKMLKNLEVSIIYESDSMIREAAYYDGIFHFSTIDGDKLYTINSIDDFDLESFFYSVSVNFSHHGLNAYSIGRWINKLFHKNDAYTTPLVINPMRDNGNFNINHELNLSKERLHANLLYDLVNEQESLLLGKYAIKEFIFYPKAVSNIVLYPYDDERVLNLKSVTVLKGVLNRSNLELNLPFWDIALTYLDKKIGKIKRNYGFLIYREDFGGSKEEQFDKFLLTDKSHVTKKIRQVINFLKTSSENANQEFWKLPQDSGNVQISFDRYKMIGWLELSGEDLEKLTPSDLIEFGLPGFFNIDLLLDNTSGGEIPFSKLSSGEQQIILNSNGLLYHLSNINSAHTENAEAEDGISRVAYKNVNIILDEVELYYHPEMQRNLVSDLIKTFEKVRNKGSIGIQGINVCILTHSPFILSDIPSQNVLNLSDNDDLLLSENTQTFGANIHEMLIGKFFMESTTGEHVRTLTNQMLDLYAKISLAQSDSEMGILKEEFDSNKSKFIFLVDNIGEDVIRSILKNHLDYMEEVFNHSAVKENEKD